MPNGSPPTVSKTTTEAGEQITRFDNPWGGVVGQAATVTYAFRAGIPAGYVSGPLNGEGETFRPFSADQQAEAERALALWADVANLTLNRVAGPGGSLSNDAAILFGTYGSTADGYSAFAYGPGSTAPTAKNGDVWLNRTATYTSELIEVGSIEFSTLLHEIGHAIGLSHPGAYNAGPDVEITYENNAEYIEDTNQYTVMSYFETKDPAEAPLLHDIAAAQRLYGANLSTRVGATTYGFNANVAGSGAAVFDFTLNGAPNLAIWDAGGIDTLDLSGFSTGGTISLRPNSFSSVGGQVDNLALAQAVDAAGRHEGDPGFDPATVVNLIENVIGGSGDDVIEGNRANNVLSGGAGDDRFVVYHQDGVDTIDGGSGSDTLLLSRFGSALSFTISAATPTVQQTLADGTTIIGIERLEFYGGAAADSITGGALADLLNGNEGADTLNGGDGNDALLGSQGADQVFAGAGDDVVEVGYLDGADTLDGGDGLDWLKLSRFGSATAFTLSVADPGVQQTLADGTRVLGFERLEFFGGDAADSVTGGSFADALYGNAGADTLKGGGGDDGLYGGNGSDLVEGGEGQDTLEGNGANDTLRGGGGDDRLSVYNGDGVDSIDGGSGVDLLVLGRANVTTALAFSIADPAVEQVLADGTRIVGIERMEFYGGSGADSVTGGALADLLQGNGGGDTLSGGGGADSLYGAGGADLLLAGAGDDYVEVANVDGPDTVFGGEGVDALFFSRFGSSLAFALSIADPTVQQALADGSRIAEIERLEFYGGLAGDSVTGGALADRLQGNAGADTLLGGGGRDSLYGSAGSDSLDGGEGDDFLSGNEDADTLAGGGGDDRLEIGYLGGIDSVDGGSGIDTLLLSRSSLPTAVTLSIADPGALQVLADGTRIVGIERLELYGSEAGDSVTGGALADTLYGNDGADTLLGGGGEDTLYGSAGSDSLDGGDADDVLGGNGDDDTVFGGAGNDRIEIGYLGGIDSVDGGLGTDTLLLSRFSLATAVTLSIADPSALQVLADGTRVVGIERLELYGSDAGDSVTGGALDDVLVGNDGADTLLGGGGDDNLRGGDGHDTLEGGVGADRISGNFGFDTASYASSSAAVVVDLASDGPQSGGDAAGDLLFSVENVTGTAFGDDLRGSEDYNVLRGGAGNDALRGYESADTLAGGTGNDTLDGGDGFDTADFSDAAGAVRAFAALTGATLRQNVGGGLGTDSLSSVEGLIGGAFGDTLTGSADGNLLRGGAGADLLRGVDGRDTLLGEGGADKLDGGVGADTLDGGEDDDILIGGRDDDVMRGGAGDDLFLSGLGADLHDGGAGTDTVDYGEVSSPTRVYLDGTDHLGVARANTGGAAGDSFVSVEAVIGGAGADILVGTAAGAERLVGGLGADKLYGKGGADTLEGGDGDDELWGGPGADRLIGGAGLDKFVFSSAPVLGEVDAEVDFLSADDQFVIVVSGFGGGLVAGGTVTLIANAGPSSAGSGSGPIFLYDTEGGGAGNLFFDGDGQGTGAAVGFAKLTGAPTLLASDFTLI